jgi:hypothetical protein
MSTAVGYKEGVGPGLFVELVDRHRIDVGGGADAVIQINGPMPAVRAAASGSSTQKVLPRPSVDS